MANDDSSKLANRLRNQERRQAEAHRIASSAQLHDKTDPFTYIRVFSRVMNGIGEEHRYGDAS